MNANSKLRKWLNHTPRPVVVVCDEQKLDAPKTDRGWAELAETIEQLSPARIVCLDAAGKVVRAKPFVQFFPDTVDDTPEPEPKSELGQFAKLLAGAYDNAGKNFEPIAKHAMDLVERLSTQVAKLQGEVDRLKSANLKLQTELAQLEAQPEAESGIAGAIMQGIAAAAHADDGSVTSIAKAKGGKPK